MPLFRDNPVRSTTAGDARQLSVWCSSLMIIDSCHRSGNLIFYHQLLVKSKCNAPNTVHGCHSGNMWVDVFGDNAPQKGRTSDDPNTGRDGVDWGIRIVLDGNAAGMAGTLPKCEWIRTG
ncbi:hypothetical protein AX15_007690 [Amanita polypyramis BW_CC]|nr:hypothetical protein AX15_007690 [Amanita polypyramis BW_CC]